MTGLHEALRRSGLASDEDRAMQERIDQADPADAAADEAARSAEAGEGDAPDHRQALADWLTPADDQDGDEDGDGED